MTVDGIWHESRFFVQQKCAFIVYAGKSFDMQRIQLSVYTLLFFVLSIGILIVAREFLVPLTLSAILAMLFIPICRWLEGRGMHRAVASVMSVFVLLSAVALIVFLLSWQLSGFTENIDKMKTQGLAFFQQMKDWVDQQLGISPQEQDKLIEEQSKGGGGEGGKMLAGFISGTFGVLVNTVLVLVYLFLFLYFRSRIKSFVMKLVPVKEKENARKVISQSAKVSQKYLGGLASMIVMLWVLYGIGFSLVGVENAIFFAILCGILEIIPFVGNITGTSITVFAVLAQGGGGEKVLWVVLVYFVVQFVQTYLLEPLVVGDQVNINPLFTIMVLVAGELIWGIAGMVMAIPLLGIVKIVCDNVPGLEPYGYLIGTDKKKRRLPQKKAQV